MNNQTYNPHIKDIYITHERGLEALAPHVVDAVEELMDSFPRYKSGYPIKNLGNWASRNSVQNGYLTAYESVDWYIARAKQKAIEDGRWQTRGQISIDQLYQDLSADPYRQKIPQLSVLIVKEDLYGTQSNGRLLNFCLGVSKSDAFSIISTARFLDRNNRLDIEGFKTVVMHEFGHILNLTTPGRANCEENLGPHCTNDGCLMEQHLDGDFRYPTAVRLRRKSFGLPPICNDCVTEGEKYFRRNLALALTRDSIIRGGR